MERSSSSQVASSARFGPDNNNRHHRHTLLNDDSDAPKVVFYPDSEDNSKRGHLSIADNICPYTLRFINKLHADLFDRVVDRMVVSRIGLFSLMLLLLSLVTISGFLDPPRVGSSETAGWAFEAVFIAVTGLVTTHIIYSAHTPSSFWPSFAGVEMQPELDGDPVAPSNMIFSRFILYSIFYLWSLSSFTPYLDTDEPYSCQADNNNRATTMAIFFVCAPFISAFVYMLPYLVCVGSTVIGTLSMGLLTALHADGAQPCITLLNMITMQWFQVCLCYIILRSQNLHLSYLWDKEEEVAAASEAKTQFIRYVFHEIRVPLNALTLAIDTVLMEADSAHAAGVSNTSMDRLDRGGGGSNGLMIPSSRRKLNANMLSRSSSQKLQQPQLQPTYTEPMLSIVTKSGVASGARGGDKELPSPPIFKEPPTSSNPNHAGVDTAKTSSPSPRAPCVSSSSAPRETRITMAADDPAPFTTSCSSSSTFSNHFSASTPTGGMDDVFNTVGIMKKQTAIMSSILDNVLNIQKIEKGSLSLEIAPFSLLEVARNIEYTYGPVSAQRGVSISTHCDKQEEMPAVLGDGVRIRQIVTNFVSNAFKFTPRGGSIDVHIRWKLIDSSLECDEEGCEMGCHCSKKDKKKKFSFSRSKKESGKATTASATNNEEEKQPQGPSSFSRDGGDRGVTAASTTPAVRHFDSEDEEEEEEEEELNMQHTTHRQFTNRSSIELEHSVLSVASSNSGDAVVSYPHDVGSDEEFKQKEESAMCFMDPVSTSRVEGFHLKKRHISKHRHAAKICVIYIGVKDSGVGIAEDDLHTLFQPFTQIQAGKLQDGRGCGLGLSICKSIVELHEGVIGATSVAGEGSEFFIEIPFLVADSDEISNVDMSHLRGHLHNNCYPPRNDFEIEQTTFDETNATNDTGDSIGSMHISPKTYVRLLSGPAPYSPKPVKSDDHTDRVIRALVVEDNNPSRVLFQKMLQYLGCESDGACNGQEALDLAGQHTYDIIFMDKEMPVMDGHLATRELRKMGIETVIVAVTGNAMDDDRHAFFEVGANEVMSKPITRKKLKDTLDKFALPVGPSSLSSTPRNNSSSHRGSSTCPRPSSRTTSSVMAAPKAVGLALENADMSNRGDYE